MNSKVKNASILITGANGGMGKETVKLLMQGGAKRVILACRTQGKAEETKLTLEKEIKSSTALEPFGGFDMNNPAEIEKAVQRLPQGKQFDTVFLQAGGMIVSSDFQFTDTEAGKIEKTIFQNVLGGYLTLMELEKQGSIAENARIVFAGGEGARGVPGFMPKPEFKSVEEFTSYVHSGAGKYVDLNALGMSKFSSALLVQKLASFNDGREYVWFTPGLTARTNGLQNVPNPKRFLFENIGFPLMELIGFAQGPKAAAQKYFNCLDGKYGANGDLIGAPEGKAVGKLVDQKPMNAALTNHQLRDAFWDITVKACGNITELKSIAV